jgi:hypothetical protein
MHVLFVEPSFPTYQRDFVRGLAAVGARVTGIGERAPEHLDGELRSWLDDYEQVPSVVHEPSLLEAVRRVQRRGWVDRLEATIEAHILPTARVREACGIPGTSVRTAFLCRDKPAMKDALREAGVPCAASLGSNDTEEIRAFAERIGYPLIVKPRDAAGASGTWRADDDDGLVRALEEAGVPNGRSVAVEEFNEGHEGFYDTLCIDGEPALEFVSHYYPNVLHAMRTRWISPQLITTNRVEHDGYVEARDQGRRIIRALGIGTSATHQEWFFGPKGYRFSEIGCRPPGVACWDLYCAANDLDLYGEWAAAIVHGRTRGRASRRFSAGMIALRPDRDGVVRGYSGVEEMQREFGEWIIDTHFPPAGSPTQPVEAGYMANAWVRMRHPDFDRLRAMLDHVGRTVKVFAE